MRLLLARFDAARRGRLKGSPMGLSGRNAVVTGGASGIGRAICLRLARDGADVAVLDLDQGGGRQVADEVAALHRRAVGVEADVASAASVAASVERLHAA